MPAKKTSVTTPLDLLQQLSHSLVAHLEKACSDAQKDAEILLAKLDKQRGKTQEKLIKARANLDDAGNAGKSKAQTRARSKLAELDDMLALLQARQSETLNYLAELKRDAEQSLSLAQGVTQVEKAAAQALLSRGKPASSHAATAQKKASSSAAKPAVAATPAKPAVTKAASGKVPTTTSRATTSRAKSAAAEINAPATPAEPKTPASQSQASGASRPASVRGRSAPAPKPATAKPVATKKPASRKPAASRKPVVATSETAVQPSPTIN
jgi:hypothetical protein